MAGGERSNLHVHYSSELYDRYSASSLEAYDDLMLRRLVSECRLRPSARTLLDVGTGTARFLLRVADDPALQALHLTGTDFFDDMLVIARRNVERANRGDRIELVHDDVHAMQFADARFDIAVSRSTIHHWADPVRALREIDRVLAPGGVALIHDVRRDPPADVLAAFNRRRADAGVEPSRLAEKYTVQEVRDFAERAGLGARALVTTAERGFAALGMELRIRKP